MFKKNNLIAFISLFLLVSTTLRAAECYEEYRKSCIENNGPRNISSAFSCTMNEQAFTKTMYGEFDSYNVLDLDDTIAYHTRVVKGEDGGDAIYSRFAVCYYQTYKKYRQTGLKPNSNQATKQSPNSGASSSQSTSPQPSAQSENSQTNAQTTTSKKGKKNPNDVPANCVKFNHDKTKIVNMCNFPINFSFCMMHQDDQSIQVANSCNDGFVAETVYPGRAISDESLNTRFFAISCKFPSKPINVRYISFSVPPEGNCPR